MPGILTHEQKQLAFRLRARGWRLVDIAREIGCSAPMVGLMVRNGQFTTGVPDEWEPRRGCLGIAEREEHGFGPDDLLFRTRNGNRPTQSNWGRALKRACRKVGFRLLTPYDGRHACATTWLRSGVPLGEAARRLGHTVETLVSTYVGALDGDDIAANKLIDEAIGPARGWMAEATGRT